MGDKKRKVTEAGLELPKKKSKKSKDTDTKVVEATKAETPVEDSSAVAVPSKIHSETNANVSASKKSRKRAADFLNDGDGAEATTTEAPVANGTGHDEKEKKKKHKESKKSKKDEDTTETLTADGVNGVVEHTNTEDLEVKTSKKSKGNSMQAEADRTQEDELEEEFRPVDDADSDNEAGDGGAALLAGFDSDTSDRADDENVDLSKTPALPHQKKTQKKLRKAKENAGEDEGPGAIYVGRVPHGFYEQQMRAFFAQFGEITKLRLARNKRSGASKHFAFVEFKHKEVAKIAAETMDNYLMYGHILKAKFAPEETLHPEVWKGANKKFRKIPHVKLEKEELEAPKSEDQWRKKNAREQQKREKKAKKLQELMGLDIKPVELKDPSEAIEQKKLAAPDAAPEEDPKQVTNGEVHEEIVKAVEAAEEAEKADAKANQEPVKEKKRKSKKAKKAAPPEAEVAAADEPATEEAEKEAETEQVRSEAAAESAAEITNKPVENVSVTKEKKPSPFRDASGKYIPPLQRKQLARAKHAKDHPEEHKQKKKAELSEKKVRRQEKKDKRKEKLKEKFGARNVKGGENYKTGGRKEKRKAERAAARAGGAKTAE